MCIVDLRNMKIEEESTITINDSIEILENYKKIL